jgi:hypothetical protein
MFPKKNVPTGNAIGRALTPAFLRRDKDIEVELFP